MVSWILDFYRGISWVHKHPTKCLPSIYLRIFLFCRITGAKSEKNIHASVSEQLKKNFAKSRWRVSRNFLVFHTSFSILVAKLSEASSRPAHLFWLPISCNMAISFYISVEAVPPIQCVTKPFYTTSLFAIFKIWPFIAMHLYSNLIKRSSCFGVCYNNEYWA